MSGLPRPARGGLGDVTGSLREGAAVTGWGGGDGLPGREGTEGIGTSRGGGRSTRGRLWGSGPSARAARALQSQGPLLRGRQASEWTDAPGVLPGGAIAHGSSQGRGQGRAAGGQP